MCSVAVRFVLHFIVHTVYYQESHRDQEVILGEAAPFDTLTVRPSATQDAEFLSL